MNARIRQAVRALVLDPDDRVLLVEVAFPSWAGWIAPGGGVAAGETDEEALRRELLEELGLRTFDLGPLVWTRRHELRSEGWDGQSERYFLVRADPFEPVPSLTWEQLGEEYVTGIRWWTIDDIAASAEEFAPPGLARLLRALLAAPPPEPIDVGG